MIPLPGVPILGERVFPGREAGGGVSRGVRDEDKTAKPGSRPKRWAGWLAVIGAACLGGFALAATEPSAAPEEPATPRPNEAQELTPPGRPVADPKPSTPPASNSEGPKNRPAPDVRALLAASEAFVRAPRDGELLSLGQELRDRGFEPAAKRVFANVANPSAEMAAMVERCLQLGQFEAADELLALWKRKAPREGKRDLLAVISGLAQGQTELTQRELAAARESVAPEDKALLDLVAGLLAIRLRGGEPGIADNPWNVTFAMEGTEAGAYQPGRIASAELEKIPPDAVASMVRLVGLVPKQGSLWALLGELLNAQGDPAAARQCLERARILLYTPRVLREHLRILEARQREAERGAQEALGAATAPPLPPGGADGAIKSASAPSGWSTLASRPRVFVVVVLGGILIVSLVLLQFREWMRAPRKR